METVKKKQEASHNIQWTIWEQHLNQPQALGAPCNTETPSLSHIVTVTL